MLTSATTNPTQNKLQKISSRGFTLLEIMIVMAIVGGIIAMALPQFRGNKQKVQSEIRKIALLHRQAHMQAKLKQKVLRIVYEMNDDKPHQIWIESADPRYLLTAPGGETDESESDDDKPKLDRDGKPIPRIFNADTSILKKPIRLPDDYIIKDVILVDQKRTLNSGKAYVHFLPQGLAEEAIIHIGHKTESLNWTLIINPITGSTDILDGEFSAEQVRQN